MSDRSDKLSFTHHREAMNAKKPKDRQKWLRRAEEGHWSVATLKSKLRQANAKEDSLDINVPNEEDTSTDEWYTPPDIIELAREVLDTIDFDPASCSKANETVKAIQFYDKNSDGLQHVWHGNVWLNPPYSKVSHFANKMVADIAAGHVNQAIVLTNSLTDASFWQLLFEHADVVCFPKKRKKLLQKNGEVGESPRYHSSFFYFGGSNSSEFIRVFSRLGKTARIENSFESMQLAA